MKLFQMILFFLLMFFWVYQIVIWISSLFCKKENKNITEKMHKFMAIIPARNEENVIHNLIRSLHNQNYPKELLDIYVIADNCTDSTALISKSEGAIVFERFNEKEKSKGYALEWFFDIALTRFADNYDAFCIFDADNIVSENFFKEMNLKLCEGELIVQGYRDIKNPEDNWITSNYAIFYWTMNYCYHYARYKLGLSPLINGTGFMVAMSVLKETNGWHTQTLTEDIEFSLNSIANGHKIGWSNKAIVYDEQPESFKQSWNQRLRWSVGHIQCFGLCFPKIIRKKEYTPILLDSAIYTLGMPMMLISLIISILDVMKFIISPLKYAPSLIGGIKFSVITILITVSQALLITLTKKKKFKKMWKGIATYPIFLVSWFLINIVAFFNLKMQWKPIKHIKSIEIHEVQ